MNIRVYESEQGLQKSSNPATMVPSLGSPEARIKIIEILQLEYSLTEHTPNAESLSSAQV